MDGSTRGNGNEHAPRGVYMDNAATSFPKPEAVYAAVDHYNRHVGAAVGRSAYRGAVEAEHVVARCRKRADPRATSSSGFVPCSSIKRGRFKSPTSRLSGGR